MTENNWRELLERSHQALATTVAAIPDDGWKLPTPCAEWNVTQVVQHAVGDQIAYTSALTGGPGPGWNPFAPSGTLDVDAADLVRQTLSESAAAWAGVDDDAADVPTPLPQGPMPAWLAAGACALDAAVHAWDLAVATGSASPLTDEMAAGLLRVAEEIVEPLRSYGAYGPVVDGGGSPVDTLLRYLGRRPEWTV
ncbi:TIGR03086 family metal-binding protein [Amycolatopsis thermophila]|uniref:Uncharacterized protein (TIGR03086 family) n=1 Tax=Amycolatopsis thermophila TaxID=206084 RepID=A0ABU0ETF8_9PSEU|nr:TIGR03086 family metal-binding protein [Amycolatopsis thermophila]MDQ0378553.1 uncharacterized protein (TIGR03086 family) [Amycolatopsis thermophila]